MVWIFFFFLSRRRRFWWEKWLKQIWGRDDIVNMYKGLGKLRLGWRKYHRETDLSYTGRWRRCQRVKSTSSCLLNDKETEAQRGQVTFPRHTRPDLELEAWLMQLSHSSRYTRPSLGVLSSRGIMLCRNMTASDRFCRTTILTAMRKYNCKRVKLANWRSVLSKVFPSQIGWVTCILMINKKQTNPALKSAHRVHTHHAF